MPSVWLMPSTPVYYLYFSFDFDFIFSPYLIWLKIFGIAIQRRSPADGLSGCHYFNVGSMDMNGSERCLASGVRLTVCRGLFESSRVDLIWFDLVFKQPKLFMCQVEGCAVALWLCGSFMQPFTCKSPFIPLIWSPDYLKIVCAAIKTQVEPARNGNTSLNLGLFGIFKSQIICWSC